ncbi:MAG: PAS domain-containing protein [Blastocatellales bacterium]
MNSKRPLILIVDDAPEDIAVYKRHLTRGSDQRYTVQTAATGAKALAMLRRRAPDCVLLDFKLPDMNGLEVLRALGGESGTLPCAVIMLTEVSDTQVAVDAMKFGAHDFLEKSWITPDLLRRSIANAVEKAAMQREIEEHRRDLAIKNLTLEQRLDDLQREVTERRRVEDALKLANERFTLAEAASNGYSYDWNIETGRVERGARFNELFGYSDSEAAGAADWWKQRLHPDDVKRVGDTLYQRLRGQEPGKVDGYSLEYRFRHKDGRYLWVWDRGKLIRDDAGRVTRAIGVAVDVTRRKQIENSLRESESRLKLAIAATNGGAWEWDLITDEVRWSDELYEVFGQARDSFTPTLEGWLNHLAPEDRLRGEAVVDAIRRGEDAQFEYRSTWPNGELRWLDLRGVTLRDERGRPALVIGITTDITKRKLAEESLRESEARVHTLAANLSDGLIYQIRRDPDGGRQFLYISDGVERLRGVKAEAVMADASALYNQIPEELRARMIEAEEASQRDLTDFRLDTPFLSPNGELRWSRQSSAPRRLSDGTIVWDGVEIDITERKRAEEALRESEEKFSKVFKASPHRITITTLDEGRYIDVNDAVLRSTGYTREEMVGHTAEEIGIFGESDGREKLLQALQNRPVRDLEIQLRSKNGEVKTVLTSAELITLNGKRCIVTLSNDITARVRAEEALRESEERFRLLANTVPSIIWTAEPGGSITFHNQRWLDYSGVSPELDDDWLQLVIHPDDLERCLAEWTRVGDAGCEFEIELRIRRRDGEYRWFLVRATPARDTEGRIANWFGAATDIHDHKQIEQALRESEDRLKLAMEAAGMFVWETDVVSGRVKSDFPEQMMGMEPGSFGGTFDSFLSLVHPDDRRRFLKTRKRALAGEEPYDLELRTLRSDGGVRWGLVRGMVHRDDQGQPVRVVGVDMDITERKQAEKKLRESRERLDLAIEAAGMFVWETDIASGRVIWSDGGERMMGMEPGSFGGTYDAFLAFVHPDDRELVLKARKRALDGEAPYDLEFRTLRPDGGVRWGIARGVVHRDERGRPIRMVGVCIDITERKQTEEALQRANRRFQMALGAFEGYVYEYNVREGVSERSEGFAKLVGFELEEAEPQADWWFDRIHPEDRDQFMSKVEKMLAGKSTETAYSTEYRVRHKDGHYIDVLDHNLIIRDAEGLPTQVVGVVINITERKRAEEALRENEEHLRLAMEAANAGSFDWDIASGIVTRSPQHYRILGLEAGNIEQGDGQDARTWRDHVYPEDLDWVESDLAKTLAERRDLNVEYRVVRSDGAIRWVDSIGHTFYNEAGTPERMLGLMIDVTERKHAEERMRESEERLRLALQGAQAGVWDVRFDPHCSYWSEEYRALYGFSSSEEATHEKWASHIHPDDLRRVEESNNALLKSDHDELRQEYRIVHPEHGVRWVLDFVRVRRDATGRAVSYGGINLDVTERKRAEEALRESEERLRRQNAELENIYQAAPIGLSLIDRDFRILRINETLAEIEGVTVGQSLGRTVREALPAFADRLEPILKRVIKTGRPTMNLDIHGVTSSEPGIERDWLASYYPVKDADGSVQGVGSVVLEITELKRAEAAVRESEERLRLAAQAASFGLYNTDLQTGENYWSPELNLIFGLSNDTVVPVDKWAELIYPDDREKAMRAVEVSFDPRGNGDFESEHRALRPDGSVRWVLARGRTLFTGKGRKRKAVRTMGVAFDITERKEAEERLHASEELFRTIFDLSGIGILQVEPSTGLFLRANHEFCNWIGYSEAELLKMSFGQITHSGDRKVKLGGAGRFLRGEAAEYSTEMRCVRKDGGVVWGLVTSRMLRDPEGRPLRTVTAVQDITERKRFEEALMTSEERYRNLIETANEGIWLVDSEASTLYVNERMANLLGYDAEEITGRKVPEFCFEQDMSKVVERVNGNLRGDYQEYDCRFRREGGGELHMLASTSPVYDTQGGIVGAMGMFTDITERKRAEEALRESEQRLKLSLTAGRAGTWEWRIKDDKLIWSEEYYDLLGMRPGDMESTLENFLLCIHPEDRDRMLAEMSEVLQERKDAEHEFRFIRPDGGVRWAQSKAQLTLDETGEPEKMVGITIDITTRVQAQMELEESLRKEQEARAHAEAANRSKDEFVAMVSHELRSPLNAMLGWSKILKKGGVDAKTQAHAVEVIERSARNQQTLIEDLLDIARIAGGKLRLETRPVNLARVVETAADVVRPAVTAREIDLRLSIKSADEVTGDSDRLQQVVWNLLSNAVKFTPHGGRVEVVLERIGPWAQITVTDTGRGIKAEDLPFIFDRFRQADSLGARRSAGLGLGLALVKNLVELHGGQVSAESVGEGQGASFTVKLPVRAVRGEAALVRDGETGRQGDKGTKGQGDKWTRGQVDKGTRCPGVQENERPGENAPLSPTLPFSSSPLPLKGVWALIVDDEADARELVATLLSQYGARVTAASCAAEAFDKLCEGEAGNRPDVLVSDISMPDEDGYMLIERVRQLAPEEGGKIPAIALTAFERPSDRIKALASGFSMHVPKPVEPEELAMVIANLTGHPGKRMNVR